ncbi:two pore domain potassium channel family protein [Actinomyces viscosus]|nr:two pore domain potassium channel family protein [Actinomyces viscosus]
MAVVALLALACYAMATHQPDQFTGLVTRTDALYFTVTTISTVGYGDVHAVGQAARGLVTAMIVFDVVFLGALGQAISQRYHDRRQDQEGTQS